MALDNKKLLVFAYQAAQKDLEHAQAIFDRAQAKLTEAQTTMDEVKAQMEAAEVDAPVKRTRKPKGEATAE